MDVNVACPPEDYIQMNTPGLDMSILTGDHWSTGGCNRNVAAGMTQIEI